MKDSIKLNDDEELWLKRNDKRFVLFPIEHFDIYELYKKAESSFWTVNEIDLSKDKKKRVIITPFYHSWTFATLQPFHRVGLYI